MIKEKYFRCGEAWLNDTQALRDLITDEIYESGLGMNYDRFVITDKMKINTTIFEEAEVVPHGTMQT